MATPSFHRPLWPPSSASWCIQGEVPKSFPGGPKIDLRRSKIDLRGPKIVPRSPLGTSWGPLGASLGTQGVPQWFPRVPKGCPRDSPGPPRGPTGSPRGSPRGPQGVPQGSPRGPQGAWKASWKRFAEKLKNHQIHCKVLQKSGSAGSENDAISSKIETKIAENQKLNNTL